MNPGKKHFEIMILTVILIALLMLILGAGAKETPKIAYITFDDGPTLNTPNIIKTLNKYNAYATFFVLEERIRMYPEYIREIVENGNSVGLHGISHSEKIYRTDSSPLIEMETTNAALEKVTGKRSMLVRVPYGSCGNLTKMQADLLMKNGYKIWDWNVDPRDSVGTIIPNQVLREFTTGIKKCKGTPVILLHDRKSTANLLEDILRYLSAEGYEMLPLSEKQEAVNFIRSGK